MAGEGPKMGEIVKSTDGRNFALRGLKSQIPAETSCLRRALIEAIMTGG